MKKFAFALPALLASAALADVGVVEATGAFQLAGASSTSYVSAIGAGSNPRINGYDFGSVNVLTGTFWHRHRVRDRQRAPPPLRAAGNGPRGRCVLR